MLDWSFDSSSIYDISLLCTGVVVVLEPAGHMVLVLVASHKVAITIHQCCLGQFFAQHTVQWPTLVLLRSTIQWTLHIQKCREVDTLRRWGLIRIGLRSPSVVIEAISLNNKRTLGTLYCIGRTHNYDIEDVKMCSTIRDSRYSHHNDYCCCGSH